MLRSVLFPTFDKAEMLPMEVSRNLVSACSPLITGTPAMGQTNVSYTLMADISALFFAKLLNYMRDNSMVKVRFIDINLGSGGLEKILLISI